MKDGMIVFIFFLGIGFFMFALYGFGVFVRRCAARFRAAGEAFELRKRRERWSKQLETLPKGSLTPESVSEDAVKIMARIVLETRNDLEERAWVIEESRRRGLVHTCPSPPQHEIEGRKP